MDELKKQLKTFAESDEVYNKIISIGNKHDIMIDMQGDLHAETQDVIIGYKPAKDFVRNLKIRLEIGDEEANSIASEINLEIFESIKDKLQKIQSQAESESQNQTPAEEEVVTVEPTLNKEETVASIEHAGDFKIENTQPQSSSPQYKETNINREALLKGIEDVPVPLVDHLLTTPISNEKVVEVKNVTDTKADMVDPYREKI